MHQWGKPGVDWAGLSEAPYYIGEFMAKYGRISVYDMKEKYGTVRVYVYFGLTSLYFGLFPFRHFVRGPLKVLNHVRVPKWINSSLIVPYQQFIYRMAYWRALKKYPHLKAEILSGASHDNLLTGL